MENQSILYTALLILLFLSVLAFAFIMIKEVIQNKMIHKSAEKLIERTKQTSDERKNVEEELRALEGEQEKENLLYRFDVLLIQSNLMKIFPFLSTELYFVGTVTLSLSGFILILNLTHEIIYSFFTFLSIFMLLYLVVYILAEINYKKTEENIVVFTDLLENYSIASDDIVDIFGMAYPHLDEPLRSAIEDCYSEAYTTGNIATAFRHLRMKVEHEKFKDIVRNIEICSRHEANYKAVIKECKKSLKEYLSAKEDRRAIMNNGRLEIAMIFGLGAFVIYLLNSYTDSKIIPLLTQSVIGKGISVYFFLIVIIALYNILTIDKN